MQFHIGQAYHLFDQQSFIYGLDDYHRNPTGIYQRAPLWYVHYLIIMAFGKAFTAAKIKGRPFPGVEYFQYAMKLLPTVTQLWKDPFTAAEILCCAALYLQCMDFRYAAYNMVGPPYLFAAT